MFSVKLDTKVILSDIMHTGAFSVKAALNELTNTAIIYLMFRGIAIGTNIPIEAISPASNIDAGLGAIDGWVSDLVLFFDDELEKYYDEVLNIFDKVGIKYIAAYYKIF